MRHQGIFCHQLLDDLPRKRLIDTALDVNVRQLIELKFWTILQFLAFARKVGLFGIRLRTDGHVFAGGHRHGAGHQSRNARDQDIILRGRRRGDSTIRLAVETMPSLAPRTAARNQPIRATK